MRTRKILIDAIILAIAAVLCVAFFSSYHHHFAKMSWCGDLGSRAAACMLAMDAGTPGMTARRQAIGEGF